MRALLLAVAFVTLALPSTSVATTDVWLAAYTTTGLDEAEDATMRARIRAELEGARAAALSEAPDPSCVATAGCVSARLKALGAEAALEVDLVRAGPLLQVSTRLHRPGGEDPRSEQRLVQLGDLERGAPLLSDALLGELRALEPTAAAEDPAPEPATEDAPPPVGDEPDEALHDAPVDDTPPSPPASARPAQDAGLPVLALSGSGLAAAGIVTLVVGAGVATAGNAVLLDPSSSAGDKELATVYGPLAIAAAVAGGVATIAGGALVVVGFVE